MSLSRLKARARWWFPRAYGFAQTVQMGRKITTDGGEWSRNALNDAILSTVIRQRLSPQSTAFDVGAAHGRFARDMSQVAVYGSVLAIEPIPSQNTRLRRIFRSQHQVTVLPYALGKESTQATFWVSQSNIGLSGLVPSQEARKSGDLVAISVPVRTLDSIAEGHSHIDFIKIDVEGGEYDVFLGAQITLSQHRPIVAFECTWQGKGHEDSSAETYALLAGLGYEVFTPIGYLHGSKALSAQYFWESIAGGHEFFFFARHHDT